MKKLKFFYELFRQFNNGRILSIVKAAGMLHGKRVYLNPPAIAPGVFVK